MKKLTKWMNLLFMTNIITRLTVPVFANESELLSIEPEVSQPVESVVPEVSSSVVEPPAAVPELVSSDVVDSAVEVFSEESSLVEESSSGELSQESSEFVEESSDESRSEVVEFEVTDWVEFEAEITETTTSIKGNIDYIWEAMRRNNLTDALWKELLQENMVATNKTIKLLSNDGTVIAETEVNADLSFEFSDLKLENKQNVTFVMSDVELSHQEDNVMTDVKIMPKEDKYDVQPDVDAISGVATNDNRNILLIESDNQNIMASNISDESIAFDAVTSASVHDFIGNWIILENEITQSSSNIAGKLNAEYIIEILTKNKWYVNPPGQGTGNEDIRRALDGKIIKLIVNGETLKESSLKQNGLDVTFNFDGIDLSGFKNITFSIGSIDLVSPHIDNNIVNFTFHDVNIPLTNNDTTLSLSAPESINFNANVSFSDIVSGRKIPLTTNAEEAKVINTDTNEIPNWTLNLKHFSPEGQSYDIFYEDINISDAEGEEATWLSVNNPDGNISLNNGFSIDSKDATSGPLGTFEWTLTDTKQ